MVFALRSAEIINVFEEPFGVFGPAVLATIQFNESCSANLLTFNLATPESNVTGVVEIYGGQGAREPLMTKRAGRANRCGSMIKKYDQAEE